MLERNQKSNGRCPVQVEASASTFESLFRKGQQLLDQNVGDSLLERAENAVLQRKTKEFCNAESVREDFSRERQIRSGCEEHSAEHSGKTSVVTQGFNQPVEELAGQTQQKSSLPYPGVFIYYESTNTVKTVEGLMEEDFSWLEEEGKVVCLEPPRVPSACVTKDEEHLKWQTQVLFDSFLRAHCSYVSKPVYTPTWLLIHLFQCHCLAANVPVSEVVDSVVAEYIETYCSEQYECIQTQKVTCVVGLVVYSDSPLHTLWSRKVLKCKKRKLSDAPVKERKSSFSKCIIVHPRDAMSCIRYFKTDASQNTTTGKFVTKAAALKVQQKYCHDHKELNKMEFGHVMCKGNRGIKSARPQCRIMPMHRKNKQEYHYSRVESRGTPLLTRDHLNVAIEKRGFRLQLQEKHHLMRHAQLYTSYYSGKLHNGHY